MLATTSLWKLSRRWQDIRRKLMTNLMLAILMILRLHRRPHWTTLAVALSAPVLRKGQCLCVRSGWDESVGGMYVELRNVDELEFG